MIKISVIIPVYNMEEYLKRCLDSLVYQTYKNIEIIIVNDGSTDSSENIIRNYMNKYKNMVLINKKNGGIGSVIKEGLKIASGDYISFVDSDDYIDLNTFEDVVQVIKEKEPEIVQFGLKRFNSEGKVLSELSFPSLEMKCSEEILEVHFNQIKTPSLAIRVMKKTLFSDIMIFERNIGVDETMYIQLLFKCKSYVVIPKSYYFVYIRENSVSRESYTLKKLKDSISTYKYMCDFVKENNKEYFPYVIIKYLQYLMFVYEVTSANVKIKESKEFLLVKEDIVFYYKKIKKRRELKKTSLKFRVGLWLIIFNPRLYLKLVSLYKRKEY